MTAKGPALDLAVEGSNEAARELLRRFDTLEEGASLTLAATEDPRRLLVAMQDARPGAFDWDVLEETPHRYRVEVTRRSPEARTVASLLAHEHARLAGLLSRAASLLRDDRVTESRERFAELRCALERHMDLEEKVLLVEFGRLSGLDRRAETRMRADHVEIRDLLREGSESLAEDDEGTFRAVVSELRGLLADHDAREGDALALLIDATLGTDEARDALVRRLQLFR